jgi:hypothetical protein
VTHAGVCVGTNARPVPGDRPIWNDFWLERKGRGKLRCNGVRLEDLAIIGNCQYSALINRSGSIV